MLARWAARGDPDADRLQGRRMLDTAEGVLIALRRCPSEAAFDELVSTARKHGVPVFRMATALVCLAGGDVPSSAPDSPAFSAAREEWSALLDENAHATERHDQPGQHRDPQEHD